MKKNGFFRFISVLLVVALFFSSAPFYVGAETGLPEKYEPYNESFIPKVRNQGSLNNGWAFAAIGAIETYVLKNDVKEGYYDKDSIDYSERNLIFDMYNRGDEVDDPEGNTLGDYNFIQNNSPYGAKPWYNRGGDMSYAMWHLLNWAGVVPESDYPYTIEHTVSAAGLIDYLEPADTKDFYKADVHVQDIYNLGKELSRDVSHRTVIKNAILEYGAVIASYKSHGNVLNIYNDTEVESDHTALLVGWDDSYANSNFIGSKPEKNGAWLIRNSLGSGVGNAGYFWISYEDMSLDDFYVVKVENNDNYDHNFHHDGAAGNQYFTCDGGSKISNVYINNTGKDQYISAVGLGVETLNSSFDVMIYMDPKPGEPATGFNMLSKPQRLKTSYQGYYTFKIDEEVVIPDGHSFSIVYTVNSGENGTSDKVNIFADMSYDNDGKSYIGFNANATPGTSFYNNKDLYSEGGNNGPVTLRIKAYTTDYFVPIRNNLSVTIPYEYYTKTEKQICPEPTVKLNGIVLEKGRDYYVKYGENIDGEGTVRVIGTGPLGIYRKIDRTIKFQIVPNAMDKAIVSFSPADYDYTSYEITPMPVVMLGSKMLKEGEDFSIAYSDNIAAGQANVVLSGVPDIAGDKEVHFTINKVPMTITVDDIHLETCDEIPEYTYSVSGLVGEDTLETAFTKMPVVTCDIIDTFSPGEYDIIAGDGEAPNYMVTYVYGRMIVVPKYTFTEDNIKLSLWQDQFLYTGDVIEPEVIVTYEGRVLRKDLDYRVTYENNIEVGMATIVVNGIREYWGEATIQFEILDNSLYRADIKVLNGPFVYTSNAISPEVRVVLNGVELEKNKDYVLAYQDNVNAGTATIVLDGIGDYRGHTLVNFQIDKAKALIVMHSKRVYNLKDKINYTYEVQGLLGNDKMEGLFTKEPEIYLDPADIKLTDGDYDICVKGGESQNYTFGYVYGKLRIGDWYTITVSHNGGGIIGPGTDEYPKRGNAQFIITADEDHVLSEVIVDGIRVPAAELYSSDDYPLSKIYRFTDIRDAHTIEAVFLEKQINILVNEKISIADYYPYMKFAKYKKASLGGSVAVNKKGLVKGRVKGTVIIKPVIKVGRKYKIASVEPIVINVTKPVFNLKAMKGTYAGQVIENQEFFSVGPNDCTLEWSVVHKKNDLISINPKTGDVTVLGTGNGNQKIVATFTNAQGNTVQLKKTFRVKIPRE